MEPFALSRLQLYLEHFLEKDKFIRGQIRSKRKQETNSNLFLSPFIQPTPQP